MPEVISGWMLYLLVLLWVFYKALTLYFTMYGSHCVLTACLLAYGQGRISVMNLSYKFSVLYEHFGFGFMMAKRVRVNQFCTINILEFEKLFP